MQAKLAEAGIETAVFAEVEPNPSLQTVQRGAREALAYEPDWIIGLGGGSCMDAAKSIWIQYEWPGSGAGRCAPTGRLGLRAEGAPRRHPHHQRHRRRNHWPIVLTDTDEDCKVSVGHPENIPDLAIVDPSL